MILVATILGFPQSWVFGEAASKYILATHCLFTAAVSSGYRHVLTHLRDG